MEGILSGFLLLHLGVCAVLLLFQRLRIFRCDIMDVFIALIMPVWGVLMLLIKSSSGKEKSSRKRDRRKTEGIGERISDLIYSISRSVQVDEDEMKERIVPLEEALVVNDTATRRELIIDVLYSNPGDYISQLFDAKSNSDTEVVHYAATALAELQKEYDLQFHEISARKAQFPEDREIGRKYQQVLEKYIDSGLVSGATLDNLLRQYSDLLGEKIKDPSGRGRWTSLCKKAQSDLRRKDAAELDTDIDMMLEEWPEREDGYKFRIHSGVLKKDPVLIRKTIQEIKDRDIYMSSELRDIVRYWDEDTEEKDIV